MTIITCTFDDAQFKVVPIVATEESIQAGCLNQQEGSFEAYSEWKNSHSSGVVDKIREYCAKDYRAMIKAAPPYPESNCKEILDSWIPCSERLPEMGVPVLGLTNRVDIGAYLRADTGEGDGSWIWAAFEYGYISDPRMYDVDDEYIVDAWMPLPSAPKGEE